MFDPILTFMAQGLGNLSFWSIALLTLVLTQITIAAVTLYLHRHQAHRGVDLHPVVSHFFRFWLWLTTGMVTKEWVAIHRKHHAKCETEEDPHSPVVYGIRKLVFDGVELYRREIDNPETMDRYGHGTPDDWLERNVYARHRYMGIVLMLALNVVLFGAMGVAVWAVQMAWIPFWAAGIINGMGHWWGYRNYETEDASTNITPLAIWIGGEEMHNNHHAFPSSARFSTKWWELDIGWLYIRLLAAVGLARVKKVAPRPRVEPQKDRIDLDTVRAVIVGRFHVTANYAKHVIVPVLRETVDCRRTYARAKRLLVRNHARLDARTRDELETVLEGNSKLETVYNFRVRLQEVWGRAASSHEALVQALREWCAQAEATGIQSLQEFARSLRGYSLRYA